MSQQSLFAFCLLCVNLLLAFYQLQSRVGMGGSTSGSTAGITFTCLYRGLLLQEGTVQSSGKIVGVFSLHLHHLSWSVPAYFQLCIVSDELAVCFKGEANLFKRVSSFLLGADGISCVS